MNSKSSILRQFIAAVLLVIFSFSITPKQLLHDVIASHKDKIAATTDNSSQVTNSGFACKCDNLVAESPFTEHDCQFEFVALPVFSEEQGMMPYRFYSPGFFFFELRGPPVQYLSA